MARGRARGSDAVVRQFGRAFPAPAWRPYYVRWEREARLRFERQWLVRAVIEVHSAADALAQIFFSSQSKGGASPQGEPGFNRLRNEFTGCGYELRIEPRLPETLLLKAFRPTGPRLAAVREEIEARLWHGERRGGRNGVGKGGIAGALVQFNRATAWKLSSCGWSRRLHLADGTQVILAMFLAEDERGRLQREAQVLLYPPQSAARRLLRKVGNLCRVAGYQGKLETARPTGGKPFLFAHFDRSSLSIAEAAPERARLDALAQGMRRLR